MEDLNKDYWYVNMLTTEEQESKVYNWLLLNDTDWDLLTFEEFRRSLNCSFLHYDGEEWTFTDEAEGEVFCFSDLFHPPTNKTDEQNCYYFYHSEKHGPNFYIKEEVPFHDGEGWKEDLVVYTQLGSGKKFVTTKERFKKFKEVWI